MLYDLVLTNGNFITMNPDEPTCNYVAIKNGKIAELGNGCRTFEAKEFIDLNRRTVIPGVTDCHVHVPIAGINLNGVQLEEARDIAAVLRLMEERCLESDGEWIFGVNYVPQNVEEKRYPTRWELDKISNGKKILIMAATLHGCAANSAGLSVCDVPGDMPGVEKEGGEQAGIFSSDESSFLAMANALGSLPDEVLWGFIYDCCMNAVRKGVTSIHGLFGQFFKDDRDLKLILERKDQLPLDMIVFYQTWNVQDAIDLGLPRVGGCLTLDGALFEYTMANFEPYKSAPALRGVLYHNDEEVYKVVKDAHAANMQCAVHAVGERAIDQLIYTYYRVIKEQGPKDLRHRIEHFCLPSDKQIQMAKDLDLILSMQPGFSYLWDRAEGGEFEYCLGRERANRWDPFNKIIDAGCTVCGGSDCPVTPVDPLLDIASCINGHNPIRNISVDEALKMYTVNAAYAAGAEKEKGRTEIGKDADFTVLNLNPYEHAGSDSIYNLKAEMTINKGNITYRNSCAP